jgi:hypothetical protein
MKTSVIAIISSILVDEVVNLIGGVVNLAPGCAARNAVVE